MPAHHEFNEAGYGALLAALRERGYRFASFEEVQPDEPHVVLRHDIDMSIAAAVRMAQIEAEFDIRTHYFILLRTELYNPLSGDGLAALQTILSLGHDIGLHFDASLYDSDRVALDAAAEKEINVLEIALGRKIGMISFHRPAASLVGDSALLAGRPHAYQPRFMQQIGYCSDSRGEWRHGHPLDHPAVREGRALQLLTHPIWWVGADAEAPPFRLRSFMDRRRRALERALDENCAVKIAAPSQSKAHPS